MHAAIDTKTLKGRVRSRFLGPTGTDLERLSPPERRLRVRAEVLAVLREERAILPAGMVTQVVNQISDEVVGLGPLERLLRDPEVSEVICTKGASRLQFDRRRRQGGARTEGKTMPSIKAAAIYARVSQDHDGELAGVKRQEKDCRALARRKGWSVGEVYVDNDLSAWNGRTRPAYQRMLVDIAAGKVDGVLVWDLDRLTRQPKELEHFFDVCDAAKLTALATYTGDIDLGTRTGQYVARLLGAGAKKASDDTRDRVRRAFDAKAANGDWKRGGERPFGYEWSDEAGTIVPYQPEAALVREAGERILNGESRRRITKDWHARGLLTTKGKPWSISYLSRILRSPRIAGLRVHRGEVVGQGNWEPLVDRETWEKVNRRLRRQGNGHRGRQRRLLTGIVVCGNCGAKLSGKTRRNSSGHLTRVYRCLRDTAASCGQLSVLAEPVERIVLNTAWTHFEPRPILAVRSGPDTEVIDNRLAELDEAVADLATARREGLLPSAEFFQQLKQLNDERSDLERERRQREAAPQGIILTAAELAQLEGPPESLAEADDEVIEFWRGVVQAVFEQVEIRGDWRGKRFREDRIVLIPRADYPDAAIPLDPSEGYGFGGWSGPSQSPSRSRA